MIPKLNYKINLDKDGYIFGFDPPTTANFGYSVFKYNKNDHNALYCESGTYNIKASCSERLRVMGVYNFLSNLIDKYNPPLIFTLERAIGRGFAVAREQLGENTGIIKYFGYSHGAEVVSIHTKQMMFALFPDENVAKSFNKTRKDKKEALCREIKNIFPEELKDRKVSKSGIFTHEADSITFCVAILNMLEIPIIHS